MRANAYASTIHDDHGVAVTDLDKPKGKSA
jgi:hypothetical protein